MNEIDKIMQQAQQFYQDTADLEGRGRFPGQARFDHAVGGQNDDVRSSVESDDIHSAEDLSVTQDIFGTYNPVDSTWSGATFTDYRDSDRADWKSVFGLTSEASIPENNGLQKDDEPDTEADEYDVNGGHADWITAFGGEVLSSPYQDGHYIYRVVPGYGSGNNVVPPILYVADLENPSNFNAVLMP